MDPYIQQVIDANTQEAIRAGELQKQSARARQVAAGAFGGSRGGVEEAEITRGVNELIGRQRANLLSQGFGQALQSAQQAFEAGKGRELQAAGLGGQLAQSEAGLAAQAAQMGISTQQLKAQLAQQQAGLGQSQAQLGMTAAQQGGQALQAAQAQAAANARAQAQAAQAAQQLRGQVGLQAGQMGQQAALQGGQLGLNAAQLAQRGALQGGQLGLQGQQALAQMAGQTRCVGGCTAASRTGHRSTRRSGWSARRSSSVYGSNTSKLGTAGTAATRSRRVTADGLWRHTTTASTKHIERPVRGRASGVRPTVPAVRFLGRHD
jgi:hypothetical protein